MLSFENKRVISALNNPIRAEMPKYKMCQIDVLKNY